MTTKDVDYRQEEQFRVTTFTRGTGGATLVAARKTSHGDISKAMCCPHMNMFTSNLSSNQLPVGTATV